MPKLNQKGIVHFLPLLLLVAGLLAGLYLVNSTKFNIFKSRASNPNQAIVFKSYAGGSGFRLNSRGIPQVNFSSITNSPILAIELTSPLGPAAGANSASGTTTSSINNCNACTSDTNRDSYVNGQDTSKIASCLGKRADETGTNGKSCSPADVNFDTKVDNSDYECVKVNSLKKCEDSVSLGGIIISPKSLKLTLSPGERKEAVTITTGKNRYNESVSYEIALPLTPAVAGRANLISPTTRSSVFGIYYLGLDSNVPPGKYTTAIKLSTGSELNKIEIPVELTVVAALPSPTPTSSPAVVTTTHYRIAENLTDLASAPYKPYTSDPTIYTNNQGEPTYQFHEGLIYPRSDRFIFVQFKDSTGRVTATTGENAIPPAQIELVVLSAPSPTPSPTPITTGEGTTTTNCASVPALTSDAGLQCSGSNSDGTKPPATTYVDCPAQGSAAQRALNNCSQTECAPGKITYYSQQGPGTTKTAFLGSKDGCGPGSPITTVKLHSATAVSPSPSPTSSPSPTPIPSMTLTDVGSFDLYIGNYSLPIDGIISIDQKNRKINLTCKLGAQNCSFTATYNPRNRTGKTLYYPTIRIDNAYTYNGINSKMLQYVNWDGLLTSDQSTRNVILNTDRLEAINTYFKVTPPQQIGSYISNMFIDAKTCNNNVNPPDCIFYGGSSFTVYVTVNP